MLSQAASLQTTLDEPVSETLKRDLRAIGIKVSSYVKKIRMLLISKSFFSLREK